MATTDSVVAVPVNGCIVCIDPPWHIDDFVAMAPPADPAGTAGDRMQAVELYVRIWGDCEDA